MRLFIFYLISFFYLLLFTLIGSLFAIITRSESLALFIPVCIWIGVSFVLPELISGQTPTALLNPVTMDQSAPAGAFFSLMQRVLGPFSIGHQYTALSSQLLDNSLQNTHAQITGILATNVASIITLIIALVACLILCFYLLRKKNINSEMHA
jgi:ABC-type transport system involved in multi-copper enzyme maturation permease subunit